MLSGNQNGVKNSAWFSDPYGIAYNPKDGIYYVVDHHNHKIRKVSSSGKNEK